MDKKLIKLIKQAKENPVFKELPDELKDPERFEEIETKLANIMISDHRHKTIGAFVKCPRCQAKMKKKSQAIKDFGFRDFLQYQNWKRVMRVIVRKETLILQDK